MENEGLPRFAILKRDLDTLLRNFAPDESARTLLNQLVLDLQVDLLAGLPLRARAKKAARPQLLKQLRKLQKASGTLALLFSSSDEHLRRAVSDILGPDMARVLTDHAFEDAGVPVGAPSERELEIIRRRSREPATAIAEEARRRRAMRGKQSARVLASFHARCHALIAAQIEVERGGQAGRPSHPEREFILSAIALRFAPIFGKVPTSTETGEFVSLSQAVLELFGLETQGLESAAKRRLRKMPHLDTSRSKSKK